MADSGGKLVEFPKHNGDVEITIDTGRYERKCRHMRVSLRETSDDGYAERLAICEDCGDPLDPTGVLWRYAQNDDLLRAKAKAWQDLEGAWRWLYENGGTISISKAQGVRASVVVDGKRTFRRGTFFDTRLGFAAMVVSAVSRLKWLAKDG